MWSRCEGATAPSAGRAAGAAAAASSGPGAGRGDPPELIGGKASTVRVVRSLPMERPPSALTASGSR